MSGSVHYPINWEHPSVMREQESYRLSAKGHKATIALLYCLHTSSSKLLNYRWSKITRDESRTTNTPINQPHSLLSLNWWQPLLAGVWQTEPLPNSVTVDGNTQLIPGTVTNISSLPCLPDKASTVCTLGFVPFAWFPPGTSLLPNHFTHKLLLEFLHLYRQTTFPRQNKGVSTMHSQCTFS